MKKILMMVAAAIMVALSAQAQKIQVVDDDGNGIPLVSVLTENGILIGTTDLNGVLADVKGASKVTLTHVAFKPQLVTIADLPSSGGMKGAEKSRWRTSTTDSTRWSLSPSPIFTRNTTSAPSVTSTTRCASIPPASYLWHTRYATSTKE